MALISSIYQSNSSLRPVNKTAARTRYRAKKRPKKMTAFAFARKHKRIQAFLEFQRRMASR